MSSYTEGQTHQLVDRLEDQGFTPGHITKLGQFDNLAGIKSVLDGTAKITPVAEEDTARVVTINETTIAVNLAATPKLPFDGARVELHIGDGWVVVEKQTDGLYVGGCKVVLYVSKRQRNNKYIGGHELREELTGKPVLNANVFDALIKNSHLIPEDWKKDENGNIRYIFFWATVYRDSGGNLYVRYLYSRGGEWRSDFHWLDIDWGGRNPAALRAS